MSDTSEFTDRLAVAELMANQARARADVATDRLGRLQAITTALSGVLTTAGVADVVLAEIAPALGVVSRALWMMNEEAPAGAQPARLHLVQVIGSEEAALKFSELPLDADVPGAVAARTGVAVFVSSQEERDRRFPSLIGQSTDGRSFACLPLNTGGRVTGVLALGFANERAFDPDERLFLGAVADQAAQAIDRARLYASSNHQAERLAFLAHASAALAASLDYEETLTRVVRLVVPRMADMATVHLYQDGPELRRVALAHRDPATETRMLAYADEEGYEARSAAVAAAAIGERSFLLSDATVVIPEQLALDQDHATILKSLDICSAIAAPLMARGVSLGILTVLRMSGSPSYRPEDQGLTEELARRAAVAIDNARLHATHAAVARTLQQSLLPPELPVVPHIDLAAAYHPAAEGVDVGGDFYDVFALEGGRWGIMIGDVCGTGPAAAALTAQVRHTARGLARAGLRHAAVVTAVNDALVGNDGDERFCTLIYAEATPGPDGLGLVVVCAGHPPPILVRAGGVVEALACEGTLVGVLPAVICDPIEVHLDPGDAALLFTDGVLEARPALTDAEGKRGFFEQVRLEEALAAAAGQGATALVSAVEDAVLTFSGGRLADDVAVLAIRAAPAG